MFVATLAACAGTLLTILQSSPSELGVTLYDALIGAFDGKCAVRDILGDGAARASDGVGPNVNGRDHHGIRADEGAVANGGCVLIFTIIVARDGTSADIYASAHGCVANVGEMRHL